jgi:predicted dehydrogenase
MKYALIGCGRISSNHIAAAMANNLKLVAICDTIPGKIEDKFSKFSLSSDVKKYTDYKEMLKIEKPDLIAIATESGTHALIALDCINCGCNLIIEKPIAMSIRDADMIIELSRTRSVVVSACHQNRFNKSIFKIREALDKGRFGKLFHGVANIRWNRGKNYYKLAPWRGTWAQDGGTLMNPVYTQHRPVNMDDGQ